MRVQSHTELIVWQKAVRLAEMVYRDTAAFPPDERFGLVTQLRRAAVSVPANIAEGHGRATRGEFLNQLSVARGSLNEVATLLVISERLGIKAAHDLRDSTALLNEISRMLERMRQRLAQKQRGSSR